MDAASSNLALKSFSLENDVKEISPQDEIFRYDAEEDRRINNEQPWKNDPHYFKTCKISAVALIKMVIHARSGVPWEIMGLMQGKVMGDAFVIVDSFALPVQGTETRVNAAEAANEYMVVYKSASEKVERKENLVGWYHSHPGYGCWLSGIDVSTQSTNQKYQDPFVAVVIDPNRTISAGKVDIGAFRCYPEGYTPPGAGSSQYQSIPLEKIEDFGVHADQYYSVNVEVFTSKRDNELLGALWNKYWVNTLSTSPLISNRAYAASQLSDLAQKLTKAHGTVGATRAAVPKLKKEEDKKEKGKQVPEKKKEDSQLLKSAKDSARLAAEAQHGLISQVLKDVLFSSRPGVKDPDDMDTGEGLSNGSAASRLENVISKASGVDLAMTGRAQTQSQAESSASEPVPMSTATTTTPDQPEEEGRLDTPMAVS